jgi:hypothetical protein
MTVLQWIQTCAPKPTVQLQMPDHSHFGSMGRPGWQGGAANRIVKWFGLPV